MTLSAFEQSLTLGITEMLLWRCLLRNMPTNADNDVAAQRILWALIFAVATATAMWMVVGNKWNLQDILSRAELFLAIFSSFVLARLDAL